MLKKTGKLNLSHKSPVDISLIECPRCVKELNISYSSITTLKSIPVLPKIRTLIADNSKLSSFESFLKLRSINNVSVKNTPVSKIRGYKLSLVILYGDQLVSINGSCISNTLREQAAEFPPIFRKLISKGFMASYPPPDDYSVAQLMDDYGITGESSISVTETTIQPENEPESELEDDGGDDIVERVGERYREYQNRLFEEYDKQFDKGFDAKIAELLESYGYSPDGKVVDIIQSLCE